MTNKDLGEENQEKQNISRNDLGDQVLDLLSANTKNPSEAFVLLQQLSVFLWAQYKIDWNAHGQLQVADTKKQRYLEFLSGLIDQMEAESTNSDQS